MLKNWPICMYDFHNSISGRYFGDTNNIYITISAGAGLLLLFVISAVAIVVLRKRRLKIGKNIF